MSSHDGTGAYWDDTYPANSEPVYKGALEIRDVRAGTEKRIAMEHVLFADSKAGGEHLQGSAVAFSESGLPTTRPDGTNNPWGLGATTVTAADDGRMAVDEDTDWFYVLTDFNTPTKGNGWTPIGSMLGGTLDLNNVNPEFTIWSTVEENADGGRESHVIWKGEKSDGTAHEQARITVAQSETGADLDDFESKIVVLVNVGDDSVGSLTEAFTVESNGNIIMANSNVIQSQGVPTGAGESLIYEMADGSKAIEIDTNKLDIKDGTVTAAHHAAGGNYVSSGATVFGPAAIGVAFVDLDLSATIGANAAMCYLKVTAASTAVYAAITNGDADMAINGQIAKGCTQAWIEAGKTAYILVAADSSGIIEHSGNAGVDITVVLVGYWK